MTEAGIMHEGTRFWVLRSQKAYTVCKNEGTHSVTVQSFAKDADGLSCAIAYARYKDKVAQAKYESEMDTWRLEDPEKFLIRIAQYLSRQYSDPLKVIRAIQI